MQDRIVELWIAQILNSPYYQQSAELLRPQPAD